MKKRVFRHRRRLILTVILLMLTTAHGTAMTAAKYIHSSNRAEHTYCPDTYDIPQIQRTVTRLDNGYCTMTGLSVTPSEDTDYPVWVRIAVLPLWENAQGTVYGQPLTADRDYTLSYNAEQWEWHDGYYYCRTPVYGGQVTPPLFTGTHSLTQISTAPQEGYTFQVKVSAETIQAIGILDGSEQTAAGNSWGYCPTDGNA